MLDYNQFHRCRENKRGELVPFETNDYEIVQYLIENNHLFVMSKEVYVYLNGVYKHDEDGILVKNLISGCILPELRTAVRIDRIYRLLLIDMSIQRKYEQINQHRKTMLNFENGMLDAETMELKEHSPDYYSINQIPHAWLDEIADDSISFDFLQSLIPDTGDLNMLLEYCGYSLGIDTRFQKMLYIKGKGGVGKSEVLKMIENAVGTENTSSLTVQNLNDRFSPIFLMGKTLNFYGDVSSEEMTDTGGFKTIIGEDKVRGEVKCGGVVFFHSYCKLIFSANRVPHANDDRTNAYYRRLLILVINERAKHFDDLTSRLEKDVDSFLYLIVHALHDAYTRGALTESENSKRAVVQLENESDSVASFINEKCIPDKDGKIDRRDLFNEYESYCQLTSRPSKACTGFYSSLNDKGYSQRAIHGKRYIVGLSLKADEDEIPKAWNVV